MSESQPPPPLPRTKGRLPFDPNAFSRAPQKGAAVAVYGVLTLGLIGLAAYMALVEQRPLASSYVAGPAIGAAWFALRLFMSLAPRGGR
ncbi:hypothetical protein [Vitreimonas flagellata]|uniref:hypothetical protein n=1 Tax=Vitreimonas flagellata TaxID=2560861 RepID=UPI001074E396|nr:hypothetical protein [Vitreimonas flagellata]